tara:strand:+ start:5369 stop:5776 length:408 start_codon:yes stop_codon:yes gene_type:complete
VAHFAKLDENNNVIGVHVLNNDVVTVDGSESEQAGIDFLTNLHGHSLWKKTSYNTLGGVHQLGGTPFRKNYAGRGFTYDSVRDAFIPPRPYASWTLNESTCLWDCPITYPDDGKFYNWNESAYQADNSVGWEEVT